MKDEQTTIELKEQSTPKKKDSKQTLNVPKKIVKRDGRVVKFDKARIKTAITKCFNAAGKKDVDVEDITKQVINIATAKFETPSVEEVQDVVETVLQAAGEYEAAKKYILYRAEHAKLREARPVPDEVRNAFEDSDKYFPTQLQKFQFYDKYARFSYEHGRRETWVETVDRTIDFLKELSDYRLKPLTYTRFRHRHCPQWDRVVARPA